ncbi:RNA polymerase sigma factor [Oryzobacter telluris]|uniref:RNA polymerase sigma factor n=1 Tax=Oryzobacter telluris TaxID=3149179 RepID=UPI00370D7753
MATSTPTHERGSSIDRLVEADALARVRAGEASAYALLVREHGPMARRLAVLSGAGPDADDVVQEAFVKAYRALPRFRTGEPFRPWLLRIVVNETRNLRRGSSRRAGREERDAIDGARVVEPPGDPAEAAVAAERRSRLLAAVRRLPEPSREVVVCRYLMELTEAETATALDLPAGTVKSRLSRALGHLREELADD